MNCKAVIFDLDGTLLNTLGDIAGAANRVLTHNGCPMHDHEDYAWFVGDGAKSLMTRALPDNQRLDGIIETCTREFISEYNDHWHVATKAYSGIYDLLDALQRKNIKLSVVTNKPHRFAGVMMNHYFKDVPFCAILGQRDGIPKKPHPQQALTAARDMGVKPSDCIFLGDSSVDIKTAQRAGMYPMGAGWGFRPIEELTLAGAVKVLRYPMEFIEII